MEQPNTHPKPGAREFPRGQPESDGSCRESEQTHAGTDNPRIVVRVQRIMQRMGLHGPARDIKDEAKFSANEICARERRLQRNPTLEALSRSLYD